MGKNENGKSKHLSDSAGVVPSRKSRGEKRGTESRKIIGEGSQQRKGELSIPNTGQ